jgi:hypothetical protein
MYTSQSSCKPKEASQFHANYFTAHNSCLKIRDASLQEKEIPGSTADPRERLPNLHGLGNEACEAISVYEKARTNSHT